MTKCLRKISALLLMFTVMVCATACNLESDTGKFEGTWKSTDGEPVTLTFHSNGTFEEQDGDEDSEYDIETYTGKYEVDESQKILKIMLDDEEDYEGGDVILGYKYEFSGDRLTLKSIVTADPETTFVKQKTTEQSS